MQLSNEEKETTITFDETPAEAIIFTYNKRWQTHLEKKLGLKPRDNGFGGKEYHIAKSRIPLPRAPRKLSPEQRQKMGERLQKARHQKSPNFSRSNTALIANQFGLAITDPGKESRDKNSSRTKTTCRSGKAQKNKQKVGVASPH